MVIILISFSLIAFIMSSIVSNYSVEERSLTIRNTADSTIDTINTYMKMLGCDFETLLKNHRTHLVSTLDKQAELSDTVIFITDTSGKVLAYGGVSREYFLRDIPGDIMQGVINGSELYTYSTLGGVFEKKHLNSMFPMEKALSDGSVQLVGAFFISSRSVQNTYLTEQMTKTILISVVWLFIVALIAIYLLSERISYPIRELSVAAKSFAQGKFDTRVPVRGEDEMAELANAFNNMATSLEKNEETRRTFLGNVSHDLRTPMTSISGFIDGILNGYIPEDKHKYYLTIVQSEVKRLSRLVSSLLDISRMQAGERKFNMAPFDICELARQILLSMEKRIDEKRLDVEFECDMDNIDVIGDRDAITQVVYNLYDNAVKFSDTAGKLAVNIKLKDKKIYFSVYNTGQGITEEDLPFVFDRFYKSDRSRGLDKTGVGLGLSIVKAIMNSHGEDIKVRSEYGKFCEFIFTLPVSM